MRIYPLALILGFVFLISCGGTPEEEQSSVVAEWELRDCDWGKDEARTDLEAGKFKVVWIGNPDELDELIADVYADDYGITAKAGWGCELEGWEECYNEIMWEAIDEEFGEEIHTEVGQKARELHEIEYGPIEN